MSYLVVHWLRYVVAIVCHYGGPDYFYRWLTGAGLVILMLHRLRDEADPYPLSLARKSFKHLLAWLQQRDALTSLDDGLGALGDGTARGVRYVITLDDGYHDNLHLLSPDLPKVPAVVYVATGHIGGPSIWAYRLIEAVEARQTDHLDLAELGLGSFDLSDPHERTRLYTQLPPRLKRIPSERLERWVDAIAGLLGAPATQPEARMLDWKDARALAAAGIQIGGHTHRHALLSRLDDRTAASEIMESHRAITQGVGKPPRHFAYPNGGPEDFGSRDVELVRRAGFATAATTIEGVNRAHVDPYRLRRFNVHETRFRSPTGKLSRALFFSETSGMLGWLRGLRAA
ncbi:MAG: polysaccharide deacetylase family protein [Lysobacter sp.]